MPETPHGRAKTERKKVMAAKGYHDEDWFETRMRTLDETLSKLDDIERGNRVRMYTAKRGHDAEDCENLVLLAVSALLILVFLL